MALRLTPNGQPASTSPSRDRDYDDIDDDDPFNPQARRIAAHNPTRGQLHSFCSYSSGLGSQCSLQPPSQTISNAPVSEYMYAQWGRRVSHTQAGRHNPPNPAVRLDLVSRNTWGREGTRGQT